jgi:outer membrane protein OmpA-like peptidoglycan-associated protein
MIRLAAGLLALWGMAAQAQVLDFPADAVLQAQDDPRLDSYALPTGIWADGAVPTMPVEGHVTRQAWRIATPSLTTLELLRPLRDQLRDARFQILFECQTEACGGFDFRFAIDTLPPPEMQVNIGDFRYLAAERMTVDGREYLALVVSRMADASFVQITRIGPAGGDAQPLATATAAPVGQADGSLAQQLDDLGHAILRDLDFATGSAQLGEADFASLAQLAAYLAAYPDRSVALVGHTDSAGALDTNIALSQRRARSVLDRLVTQHGVNRRQLTAEGMGYLAPIASNRTETGRDANRRVEAIVTSTD